MKKNKIVWLFIVILLNACTVQKKVLKKKAKLIDTENRLDVIVADLVSGSMFSLHFGLEGLSEGTHFFDLSPQSTSLMDLELKNTKKFSFFDGEKNMEIECKCDMNHNYFIKNLKIKEGNYVLNLKKRTKIKGDKIKVSDSLQNILFKNIQPRIGAPVENIYFKDLEFTILDLSDTLSVKLLKK